MQCWRGSLDSPPVSNRSPVHRPRQQTSHEHQGPGVDSARDGRPGRGELGIPGGPGAGRLPPEEIVKLLAHLAAELDKDAQELQDGLTVGKLPPWVGRGGGTNSTQKPPEPDLAGKDDEATWE